MKDEPKKPWEPETPSIFPKNLLVSQYDESHILAGLAIAVMVCLIFAFAIECLWDKP